MEDGTCRFQFVKQAVAADAMLFDHLELCPYKINCRPSNVAETIPVK